MGAATVTLTAAQPNGARRALARPLLVGAALGLLLVYLASAAVFLPTPLRFDEVDFAAASRAIARSGRPVWDFAEENALLIGTYYGYAQHYGLWHPPLYLYVMALPFLAFGFSDLLARAVGAACLGATVALSVLLARRLAESPAKGAFVSLFSAAGLVTIPLTLQGSFYIDIDNTVLAPLALLFVWSLLGLRWAASSVAAASAVLGLLLWAKIVGAPLLLAGVLWDGLLGGVPVLGRRLVVVGLGVLVFAATWLLYCVLTGLPPLAPFEFTLLGKSTIYSRLQGLGPLVRSVRWHLAWLGPAFWVLAAGCALLLFQDLRSRRSRPENLLGWCGLAILSGYVFWFSVIGKYVFPAVPLLLLFAGCRLWDLLEARPWATRVGLLLAGAAALLHLLIVPDLLLRTEGFEEQVAVWRDPRVLGLGLAASIALAGIAVARWRAGLPLAQAALLAGATIMLPANLVQDTRSAMLGNAPLRTLEEPGFRETVVYLNARLGPDEVIASPKDVGFYLQQGRYLRKDGAYTGADLAGWVEQYQARFVVESRYERVSTEPPIAELLARRYDRGVELGVFKVYERQAP